VRYCPNVVGLYGQKFPFSEEVWTKITRIFVTFMRMSVPLYYGAGTPVGIEVLGFAGFFVKGGNDGVK
jgi:hypothetical protein